MTTRNYISRHNTIVQESVHWVPWPGPSRRRGRGRATVAGRRQSTDRTPFFQVTPALRKDGYVLSGVDGTRPPTRNQPRCCSAAGRAAACEERRFGDCKDRRWTRAQVHMREHAVCAQPSRAGGGEHLPGVPPAGGGEKRTERRVSSEARMCICCAG